MKTGSLLTTLLALIACSEGEAPTASVEHLAGTPPITSGVVIRGVTLSGPPGQAGTSTARNCDFSHEEVDQTGRMTGASVQCLPGSTLEQALAHLPARFNAYCAANATRLNGRLIAAPVPGNPEHCDLSALKPRDAQSQFKGAMWR